ncbi:MAG TPA: hypothetical protein VE010_08475 [Thermoanaerobaculia bacterium]|nr:hypothetical protein [Thermoanaerobaculia bacterium]
MHDMAMVTRAPFAPVLSRAARVLWWCGVPLVLFVCVIGGDELYRGEFLYAVANAVLKLSPLAAELVAEYPLSLLAMLLLASIAFWSHVRGTHTVRLESLALPVFIGGLEACGRLSWFLTCRGGSMPSLAAMHNELHLAASASLIAMTAPLFIGAILLARWPRGVSGSLSRRTLLSVVAVNASIALIWFLYDLMLRAPSASQAT